MNDKADAVIALAESKLGDPYVYGASGQKCTPEVRRRYAGYHPEYRDDIYKACPVLSGQKSSCAGCKWDGHLCYDCRGFTYFLLRTCGVIVLAGGGATTQYADASNWDARGTISDGMPNLVGCLFKKKGTKMSHTGLHAGDGEIVHCSTVVKTGTTGDKSWTHWAVPKGLYSAEELREALEKTEQEMGKMHTTLRRGSKGDEVRELQLALYRLVSDKLEIDGVFGAKTEAAAREFQTRHGLAVDGIVGPLTWAEIDKALGAKDEAAKGTAEVQDGEATSSVSSADTFPRVEGFGEGEITLPNEPVELTYPGGQTITMQPEVAEDLIMRLQEQLAAGGAEVEIVAPVGLTVTVTAVGAVNIWQQIREVSL